MFNQTIIRVGVRYGVLCGVVCFVLVMVLYFAGTNPFGDMGRITYLPIPIFIFLAIRYFKLFHEGEIGFGRGFRVGLSVSFYTALSAAMLVFLFVSFAGPEILQNHIAEMKMLLEETREEQIKLIGKENFETGYKAIDTLTPSMLAADDFLRRILVGGVFSLVAAVFFRK
ncbi:hypothetical protein ABID22_003405 [Pontibacter aydingkolensis]|uniref:DUF4199 domain-containing protein n=1 Tax=Pontibacter aydingkolensis TaxID=1911536 RepID=A0ABS7CY66_9BACT|nr:DUF4199 domain-containing protein [Pontibacter aydingkolensis]MBW7468813.1 DUF4199 domain-containing protein [Pontibacter aydingkolensis]